MEKFDVVVVGAGTAGCLAAKTVAEAGLKACVIERKRRQKIGEKICGDALGEHHLKTVGLEKPQGGELEKKIEGVKVYSPDLETVFTIAYEDYVGYMLNRRLFGQWLLKKALDKSAILFDLTQCLEPITEKNFVTGVLAKNMKTGENIELKGKVVLDASGFMAVIRRRLPKEMGIFTKGGAKVNAGVGVCMRGKFPNPRNQFYKYVLTKPLFEGSLLLKGGMWYDPTRRPLDNMVGNGVAILGDAACLANPIHGGGIGPSMLSGYLAGKTIVEALEKGDVSQKSLWPYNHKYMEMYGTKQAGLDVFRMFLLNCRDEDLNYGMKYKLLTEEDVLKASLGQEFHLNVTETAKRVFRGLKRIRFLNKLRLTVNLMREVKAHYRNYPQTSEGFQKWRMKRKILFKEARAKLTE